MFNTKIKKIGLFKSVNILMTMFCLGAAAYNYCGVDVLTNCTAHSNFGGNLYEYSVKDDSFCVYKNNALVGSLKTNRRLKFRKSGIINFTCNASAIAAAGTIAGVTATAAGAGSAVAIGTIGGNLIAASQITGAAGSFVGIAAVGVAAASPLGLFLGAATLT